VVRKPKKETLKGHRLKTPDNKCFSLGHFKAQCKNLIKRFSCCEPGHVHYKCTQKDKERTPTLEKGKIKRKSSKKFPKHHREMANNFYEERPTMTVEK
jgi:hypothetical protein